MKNGVHRVIRGGASDDDSGSLRPACRVGVEPVNRGWVIGLRIVVIRRKQ